MVTLDDIEERFICGEYIKQYKNLFLKQGQYHCCRNCKQTTVGGVMPSVAAKNKLKCPWEGIPNDLLKLNKVENGLVAPCKIFANIHHLKVKITGSKKTTAVPIVMDNAEDP